MATEEFHYTIPGTTKKIVIPHFNTAPFGVVRKARKEGESEVILSVLEHLASEDTLALIDELPSAQFAAFNEAWQKASKPSAGESSAS